MLMATLSPSELLAFPLFLAGYVLAGLGGMVIAGGLLLIGLVAVLLGCAKAYKLLWPF